MITGTRTTHLRCEYVAHVHARTWRVVLQICLRCLWEPCFVALLMRPCPYALHYSLFTPCSGLPLARYSGRRWEVGVRGGHRRNPEQTSCRSANRPRCPDLHVDFLLDLTLMIVSSVGKVVEPFEYSSPLSANELPIESFVVDLGQLTPTVYPQIWFHS